MTAKIIVLCLTAAALLVIAVVALAASFRGVPASREPLVRAVRKLIYGAPGDAARATGFDEGDKTPDWRGSLEKRGVRVVGPMLEKDAETPFRLYRETSGTIY